ncbi:hypothetical protein [Nocardia fusca]|uniref:DUF8020 domain-containing protein n=1 Tax=Nocardia fusca TaxID=941183 RepID=A0ABV3FGE7_9NOCA
MVTTGAVAVATGAPPAGDAPAVTAPAQTGVHYTARLDGLAVVTTVEDGARFTIDGDTISVRDSTGQVLQTLPVTFTFDGQQRDIAHEVSADGTVLRLTPDTKDLKVRSEAQPIATPLENQLALNDLINAASINMTIGSLIGTIIGTVLGIGVGFVMAGAACLVISLACVVTVLPIMALVAGVGGIIGLDIGGAAVIPAVMNYVNTLNAPDGTSIYASQIPALATPTPAPSAPPAP